jgi:hypothetical protein
MEDPDGRDEILKSLRLPADLAGAAEQRARERGLTFSDLVEAGLRQQVGWPTNPMFDLIEVITEDLLERFPHKRGFPQDVTLDVFRGVRAEKRLWKLYEAATTAPDGKPSDLAKDTLHRRIGKTVKAVLDANVVGRSVELGDDELIKTHALLVPAARSARK